MKFEYVTDPKHPMYVQAMELYKASFPPHEQREPLSQETILQDKEYHFALAYDDSIFVGMVLYWETEHFLYIEHLCILPEMRNRQYGKKILSLLTEKPKLCILEIDPPVDGISRRRKGFYERCGFIENPLQHIHPPYHRGNEGHRLVIMSSPRQVLQSEYTAFSQYLQERVMASAFV